MNLQWSDSKRMVHAIASNLIAGAFPALYVRMTHQTGRGGGEEQPAQIADYFSTCFFEYFEKLDVARDVIPQWLSGKTLLEYGPGDLPGVALLMVAYGAEKVWCVDRFPLVKLSDKNVQVMRELLEKLPVPQRQRAEECFNVRGDLDSGFNPTRIEYLVRPSGLSGFHSSVDLVYSRAVLEHVNQLAETYADMRGALRPNGISIHQVDLKSHGLHKANPLDFLAWPSWLWNLMYGFKGVPNRWRKIHHLQAAEEAGLVIRIVAATTSIARSEVEAIRPYLAKPFRQLDVDELAVEGFWLICTPALRDLRMPGMTVSCFQ